MHGSGKDAAEHYPKIARRTELGTHNGSEDRSSACNVEELDEKHFPVWHYNKVNAIGIGDCRCKPVVGGKHLLHEFAVGEIAYDKQNEANCK